MSDLNDSNDLIYLEDFYQGFNSPTSTHYELTNHLGNILATVSGRKLGKDDNDDNLVDYYEPEIVQATDYYPFGAQMPDRDYQNPAFAGTNDYRFGFNGKELQKDGEFGSLTHFERSRNPALAGTIMVLGYTIRVLGGS